MEKNKGRISEIQSPWIQWQSQWINFFIVVSQPSVLIPIIAAIVLLWVSIGQSDILNPWIQAILAIFISITSGWVGSSISKRWDELTEGKILIIRGKSAIRSLNLLLRNIAAIENRITHYIKRLDKSHREDEFIRNSYEEIAERCITLRDVALNSIQHWADIVPEAEAASEVLLISKLKTKAKNTEREKIELVAKLSKAKEESKEKKVLEKRLEVIENQLYEIRMDLEKKHRQINASPILKGISEEIISGSSLGVSYQTTFNPQSSFSPETSFKPFSETSDKDVPDEVF